jgi:anti-sigma regulatory factor (Ser/Thr protein kinase)
MAPAGAPDSGQERFRHSALIHRTPEEYLGGVLSVIEQGLAQGEPVIVAIPPARLELISGHLNGKRKGLELVDITELGRNPAWIIPALQRRLEPHRARHVYLVCEPMWPGRSPDEIEEVILHEALSNSAFADRQLTALCPYDATSLEDRVIQAAMRTHRLIAGNGHQTNSDFDETLLVERLQQPLPPLPAHGQRKTFSASSLGAVRTLVADQASTAGLAPTRSADLVFAVNELATNSIRHGGGSGELELRVTPERVVAEVRDKGRIADPLVGRVTPDEARFEGLGLWLVNQMCDLVQVRSGAAGTTVRVSLDR